MVVLTGDTHGTQGIRERLSLLKFALPRMKKEHLTIIVLGDFGLMLEREEYERDIKLVEERLSRIENVTLAFLSGNHENFDIVNNLEEVEKWGNKVGYVSENIYHLKTGRVYEIEGETYAIYGGALSIDKYRRIEGVSWWKEEIPSKEENQLFIEEMLARNWEVDYLLTHTAATNEIRLIDMYPFTGKLEDFVARDIQVIKEGIEIRKFHAFGHFHINKNLIEEHKIICLYDHFYIIPKEEENE